jgi:hypothetical protein
MSIFREGVINRIPGGWMCDLASESVHSFTRIGFPPKPSFGLRIFIKASVRAQIANPLNRIQSPKAIMKANLVDAEPKAIMSIVHLPS